MSHLEYLALFCMWRARAGSGLRIAPPHRQREANRRHQLQIAIHPGVPPPPVSKNCHRPPCGSAPEAPGGQLWSTGSHRLKTFQCLLCIVMCTFYASEPLLRSEGILGVARFAFVTEPSQSPANLRQSSALPLSTASLQIAINSGFRREVDRLWVCRCCVWCASCLLTSALGRRGGAQSVALEMGRENSKNKNKNGVCRQGHCFTIDVSVQHSEYEASGTWAESAKRVVVRKEGHSAAHNENQLPLLGPLLPTAMQGQGSQISLLTATQTGHALAGLCHMATGRLGTVNLTFCNCLQHICFLCHCQTCIHCLPDN